MKASIVFAFILTAPCLLSNDIVSQSASVEHLKRDLTLIANPAAFPPSAADLAKFKTRVLKADQDAVLARISAIEARMRKVREDSEARIRALSEERDALTRREKEIRACATIATHG